MQKLAKHITVLVFFFLVSTSSVFALGANQPCNPQDNLVNHNCDRGLICQTTDTNRPTIGTCQNPSNAIQIEKPQQGFATVGNAISNLFSIALVIAVLVVLVMLIIGAFEWITSGGDKEAVAKARNRIINALIGLVVLAVAFALARLAGQIAGFPNIFDLTIPTPNPDAPGV